MNTEEITRFYFNRLQAIRRTRFKENKKDIALLGISEHYICNSFYELCFRTRYAGSYKKALVYITDWGPFQKDIREYLGGLTEEDRHNTIEAIYEGLLRLYDTVPLVTREAGQGCLV
jgi:hypothetical protein